MQNKSRQPDNTFIVRFWWEWGIEKNAWVGNVHHIQSGINIIFKDKQELIRFIEQYIPFEKRKRIQIAPPQEEQNL